MPIAAVDEVAVPRQDRLNGRLQVAAELVRADIACAISSRQLVGVEPRLPSEDRHRGVGQRVGSDEADPWLGGVLARALWDDGGRRVLGLPDEPLPIRVVAVKVQEVPGVGEGHDVGHPMHQLAPDVDGDERGDGSRGAPRQDHVRGLVHVVLPPEVVHHTLPDVAPAEPDLVGLPCRVDLNGLVHIAGEVASVAVPDEHPIEVVQQRVLHLVTAEVWALLAQVCVVRLAFGAAVAGSRPLVALLQRRAEAPTF
mmetsp:Transcript_96230/g.269223  ORF Transcript_96230/g.269223 Transcript_96230/m.269223 type:complete len:254 (+) Transcript_96230:259-1020(+)